MEMWSTIRLQLLLCLLVVHSAMVVSEITLQLEGQEYQNHSVVPLWRITEYEPLTCTATVCGGCSLRTANPKWFYPDGTEVIDSTTNLLYITGAVKTNQIVTLNLYRRGQASSNYFRPHGKGSGLYRCRIHTSVRSVQNAYVGLYRGLPYPNEGKLNVTSVQFHLDNASTDPFQFGPPVFTLTCHSTGGPATTVIWKKGNIIVNASENHIMTRTVVEQSGPVYINTLTVSGWEEGWFSCNVSNTKGHASGRYRVQGTNRPREFTAIQVDATTVLISWRTPVTGAPLTPSGYRFFYRPERGQTISTTDTGPGVRKYRLTDLMPGTTYMIAMVTLSEKLPSPPTNPVSTILGLGLTVLLQGQKYQDHEVVSMWRITETEPLTCTVTICGGCSLRTANPKWFYPDGTEVTDSNSNLLYTTSAMETSQTVTVNLYRRGEVGELLPQDGRGVGLYRCRMQTSASASSVQNAYVGLYRGQLYPNEGQPNVTSLDFHLDNASTDPFQSGPPVFTLTCHSTGGPATTVTWKKENTVLIADESHIMTRTLVEQSGPVYNNTLTVSGRELGWFTCNISNTKGSSGNRYRVQGTTRPCNLTAVQIDATTVLVSWTTPTVGGLTPSGYRIFYLLQGGQTITTPDTGPDVIEYRLIDLMHSTTYMIAMVTLSEKLPSHPTNPVNIILVPAPSTTTALTASGVNTKHMTITWNDQLSVGSYIVSFIGVTNCSEMKHTAAGSRTPSCSTQKCTYNLTGLNEYSQYSITVTAVNVAGNASATINASTLPAPPTGLPKNLTGTADVSTITVKWDEVDCTDRNSEIVNYTLTYWSTSRTERKTFLIPADNMVYTIRGLRPETNYTIELAAVNTAGQVGPMATIILQTLIPAPTSPAVMVSEGGLTSKSITLSWSDQRRIDHYVLTFIGITGCSGMRLLHSGNCTVDCGRTPSKCTYNLTGLNEYSQYSITVTAVNAAGNASSNIRATTLPAQPSGPPENVRGAAGVSTITVQWDEVDCIDRNSEIVNYKLTYIYRNSSVTTSSTVLVPADNMVYTIRGLRPETNYTIELAAVNTAGQVGSKDIINVMTLPNDQDPSDSHSSSDENNITIGIGVSVCVVLTTAVVIAVAAVIGKWVYKKRASSITADMRKESKAAAGHELYSISTTDCVAYGTATNRSGDCQEARDYEIPAVTPTSLPVSATACEEVQPAIYEPIPH